MIPKNRARQIGRALARTAPNDVADVLSRCTEKGSTTVKKTTPKKWIMAIAACLAVILIGSGLFYRQAHTVASVVSLDVNPSIELEVSRNEKVLRCTALNDDAKRVLAELDGGAQLNGTSLNVAVHAIIGGLVRSGYLTGDSSALLISVEDSNANRAAKLQRSLTAAADTVLQAQETPAAVLSQTLRQDADRTAQAKAHDISAGKAALVERVRALNGTLAYDRLAKLSVDELDDLLEAGAPGMPIGKDAAVQAAADYAGVARADVTADADAELDESPAHYDVTLHHPTLGKLSYQIDAYTGAVLRGTANAVQAAEDIGAEGACAAAYKHAGVNAADAVFIETERDADDGVLTYDVAFTAGNIRYEYEIDGRTGAVLDAEKEWVQTVPTGAVDAAAAKAAALKHAGVREDQTTYCHAHLEYDDGIAECWEVEFAVGAVEYEYEIALDGTVQKSEQESHAAAAGVGDIGAAGAQSIAMKHAGVRAADAAEMETDRDTDGGRIVYEVEFRAGQLEYEYEIDGASGAVLKHKVKRDD